MKYLLFDELFLTFFTFQKELSNQINKEKKMHTNSRMINDDQPSTINDHCLRYAHLYTIL